MRLSEWVQEGSGGGGTVMHLSEWVRGGGGFVFDDPPHCPAPAAVAYACRYNMLTGW